MRLPKVDAVVVGSGAAGGVVAWELSRAGIQVALLERGHNVRFQDTGHDELFSQRTTVLGNAFGPDSAGNPRLVKSNATGQWHKVLPHQGGYNNIAACVGGGTKSYGAMSWRFMREDFEMRSVYGAPPNSTLEDWPISYDDLEPYYEKAEWDIGISGQAGANTFEAPRKKGYPMKPLPYTTEGKVVYDAAKRLGWHPFPIPMAINSESYMQRPGCIYCPHCVGFACEVYSKSSTADTVIPRAVKTGHCELRTGCMAAEVLTNAQGRGTGVRYFQGNEEHTQPADVIIVSASATESARLLLNSTSKLFPRGLGNNNDWVGRNLQGHAYAGANGIFEEELYDGTGPAACVAMCDFNHHNDGLRGGAMLANEFIRLPYLFARRWAAPMSRQWGLDHKQFMRRYYRRSAGMKGPVQEMPVFENRVEVEPSLKDAWGIPVLKLSGARHPHDRVVGRFIADRAAEVLHEAGAIEVQKTLAGTGLSGGQHQSGTCRMGNDPKTSVTDKYGRIHDVDNVFVVDGSLHVTNGGFNPALTIQALAYWCSDHIVRQSKGNGFGRSAD